MDDAVAYASERYAFGKPIGTNPLIQDMLAEMETILENSRNMLYKNALAARSGRVCPNGSRSLLKRYATVGCTKVADMALEIFAALGYTTPQVASAAFGLTYAVIKWLGGTVEIMVPTSPDAKS